VSYLTDLPSPIIAAVEVQARSRLVLKGWRCSCSEGCVCFEYRYLLNLCAQGKPLYPKQHEMVERLLLRDTRELSVGVLRKR
jgi:hypothetical protein